MIFSLGYLVSGASCATGSIGNVSNGSVIVTDLGVDSQHSVSILNSLICSPDGYALSDVGFCGV